MIFYKSIEQQDQIKYQRIQQQLMIESQHHIPISIQFPSFAPSLQSSPKAQKSGESSTFQSLNSPEVHKISIHLPEQLFEQEQNGKKQEKQPLTQLQSYNNKLQNNTDNIRVFCRLRKPTKSQDCVKYDSTMIDDGQNCYSFDQIFHKNAVQKQIYEKIARRHIHDFFIGKNSTIFAYGQTGSGKTHTMFGKMDEPTEFGIIPRALQQIFNNDLTDNTITCSMLQIYNEKLFDLFSCLTNSQAEIRLKQVNDSIFLEGLQQILVESKEEILNLIKVGHKSRKISSTLSNDASSRSHTVLFVYRNFVCRGQEHRCKLCFIDLAGSEKVKKSGAIGKTLEQTKKINLSLSCLGNVVHSLTNGSDHIPYRNSKLTRILKDSLAAETSTSIITTCSLEKSDYNETLSTVKFAVRAKKIKNKRKLQNQSITLQQQFIILKKQLQETKKELAHYKEQQKKSVLIGQSSSIHSYSGIEQSFQGSSYKKMPTSNKQSAMISDFKKLKTSEGQQIAEQQVNIEPIRNLTVSNGISSRIRVIQHQINI